MLNASKFTLFEDTMKAKLESPGLSLEAWKAFLYERKVDMKVERVEIGKTMVGKKKYCYKITTTDAVYPGLNPAVRSYSDVLLLQNMLATRFPDALVPRISGQEIDNLHLLELYLKDLSGNPFFRTDVTYHDFFNGKMKEYKQVKKNERKHSEGTLRWLQQRTDYPETETPKEFFESIKSDMDQLETALKRLVKGFIAHTKMLDHMQESTGIVSGSLGDYLAMEQTSENTTTGSICGLPKGRLRSNITKLIEINQNHQRGLELAYDSRTYERLMIHPVLIELKGLTACKKLVDVVLKAKNSFQKSKIAYEALPPEDPKKEAKEKTLEHNEVFFFKARRALGYELEKFKTFRTLKFQQFFESYVKFNLRMAKQVNLEWCTTGVSLNQNEEQTFFAKEQFYKGTQGDPIIGLRNRGMSVSGAKKTKKDVGIKKMESLEVVHTYNPGNTSKYLKVTEGDLLTGVQMPNGDWRVTNSRGKKGLVKAKCVRIKGNDWENQTDVLDGIKPLEILENADDGANSDWTEDDEPMEVQKMNLPPPVANSKPGPPGGNAVVSPFVPQQSSPVSKISNHEVSSPHSQPKAPSPPIVAPTGKMLAFSPPTTTPEVVNFSVEKSANKPKPPGFNPKQEIKKTPTPPAVTPKNVPKPPNVGAGKDSSSGGRVPKPKTNPSQPKTSMPTRPAMGGLLADIKKVNPNKVLKKVPDQEKSKEIGGEKTKGPAVVPGGGSSRLPPGGGLAGELALKLQKRR